MRQYCQTFAIADDAIAFNYTVSNMGISDFAIAHKMLFSVSSNLSFSLRAHKLFD